MVQEIASLKKEKLSLMEEIKNLNHLVKVYKKDSEKLKYLFGIMGELQKENIPSEELLIDSISFSSEYPLIKIEKFKYNILRQESKGTKAARMLMDFLFLPHEIKGMSFQTLKDKEPEKMGAILDYAISLKSSIKNEIVKSITSKCKGK